MRKALSRTLYLIGLVICIVGGILLGVSFAGSTGTYDSNGVYHITSVGNSALLGISIFLLVIGGILGFIAYVGALIKTAMLGRWGWFVCLLLISGITMLVYIFAGPETRPAGQVPMGYPPQPGYPPQGYPGYPPQQGYPPQPGYPPQGYPQQGNPPPYPPSGYPQSDNPPQGGYPPVDYPRP